MTPTSSAAFPHNPDADDGGACSLDLRAQWLDLVPDLQPRHSVLVPALIGWLIAVATIPVGITGLVLEHTFRTCSPSPSQRPSS